MEGKTVSFFKSSTWGKTPWKDPSHDLSSGPMTSSGSDSDPITRRANYTFVIIIWKNCMMKTLLIG